MEVFNGLQHEPVLAAAQAFALAHLPPETEAVLLHGDLLGQNIPVAPDEPPGLVDWAAATRGDPAYDLAIVTRGVKQPFQIADGLARLLRAYKESGGIPIRATEVYLHELCLAAGWYRDAQTHPGHSLAPKEYLNQVYRILTRAQLASREADSAGD
jgi:aminoglycoside phosphotransferase (APT) family kinase protein